MTAVRRAEPADAPAVAETFTAAFAGLTYLPKLHTADEDRAFFGRVVAEHEVWVAEQDGRIVGFAALSDDVLEHIYVRPDLQGRGIGGALLDVAKQRRPNGFGLWVFQQNAGARRFYERHGLQLVRETDGAGNEERTPDAFYKWHPPAAATG
jgi:ribosomal protein S18 acetylase RimI-like enzyme